MTGKKEKVLTSKKGLLEKVGDAPIIIEQVPATHKYPLNLSSREEIPS